MYIDSDWIPLIVLPLIVIGITVVIVLPWVLKTRERFKALETFRFLTEKGQTAPAELLAGLVEQPRQRRPGERDLRASIIWLSVAIGISALGSAIAFVSDPHGNSWVIAPGIGAFPASIGIGYLVLWFMNRSQRQV